MCTAITLRAGVLILLCLAVSARSQDALQDAWDPALLEIMLDPDREADAEALLDEIDRLRDDPLCLAGADRAAIASLPFLDAAAVDALCVTLAQDQVTWADIATSLEGDASRYALLRACTVLACGSESPAPLKVALRSRFQQEDRPRSGFLDGSWHASRARWYQRLRIALGPHVRAAALAEKDPGEQLLTDHVSGYVSVEDLGVLRRAVLGDLSVSAGQGLVFWQGFAMAKSSQVTGVRHSSTMLRPVVTSAEGGGTRGIGLELALAPFEAALFLSSVHHDATLDTVSGTFGSLGSDGLHRSASERQRTGQVREERAGLHTRYRHEGCGLQLGASVMTARYSRPSMSPTPFSLTGDRAWCGGIDLRWDGEILSVVSEAALSHTHAGAVLAGVDLRPSGEARLSLQYRRYDAAFISLQGNGFGERAGRTQNEEGLYCGLRCRPCRDIRVEIWADVFRYPNRTAATDMPVSGNELRMALTCRPAPRLQAGLRLRHEQKEHAVAARDRYGREIRPLTCRRNAGVRIDLEYQASSALRLRLRGDYTRVTHDRWVAPADGYLLAADLLWRPVAGLSLGGSLCMYRSDDWDSRLYRFERDVRGVMRSVAFDGEGARSYLLCALGVTDRLECSARYALTVREGVRTLGTGKDAVTGDRLGTLSLQVDWTY